MKTLVVFVGKAGSGKSSAAQIIQEHYGKDFPIVKFADPLYKIHNFFFKKKQRWFLQFLGKIINTFSLRAFITSSWFSRVEEELKNNDIVICDDLRFPEEADTIIAAAESLVSKLIVVFIDSTEDNRKTRTRNTLEQLRDDSEVHIDEAVNILNNAVASLIPYEFHTIAYSIYIPNNDDFETFKQAIINVLKDKINI